MPVSQNEAFGKLCVHMRGYPNHTPTTCIGDACMAWRWWGYRESNGEERRVDYKIAHLEQGGAVRLGSCGLVGEP